MGKMAEAFALMDILTHWKLSGYAGGVARVITVGKTEGLAL